MIILLIVTLCLPVSAGNSYAGDLNPTQYVLKGKPTPFTGFLVEPDRFEKTLIAIADLESTRAASLVKLKELEAITRQADADKSKFELERKKLLSVEEGLKKELAAKSVFYRQPWFVATSVAVLFIATGVLLP